jgi:hypothetical protein
MKWRELLVSILALCLFGHAQQPNNVSQWGGYTVSPYFTLFNAQSATATATSSAIGAIGGMAGFGTLQILGASITGSPSGCSIALAYELNLGGSASSAQATISFTPGNSLQLFPVTSTQIGGDTIVATYACATYPTAGTISVTFAPSPSVEVNQYNSSLPTVTSGNYGIPQIDANGRRIVVGGGTAGSPAGGVVSVQGVSSGTAIPASCTAATCAFNLADLNGAALGSPTDWGTAPTTSTEVIGVNANEFGVYNSSPIANPSTGASVLQQMDLNGNLKTMMGLATQTLTAWTSTNFTTSGSFSVVLSVNTGAPAVIVQLDQTTTITGGAVTWQGTYDGTNWVTIPAQQVLDPTSATFAQIANPYTFVASTNKAFLILLGGYQQIRASASTTMTGTGTITPYVTQLNYSPGDVAATQPVDLTQVLGATMSKTNPVFDALTDQTNVITAAISALGTAPAGTEVMAVNAVGLPSTAAGASLSTKTVTTVTTGQNIKASAGNLYGVFALSGVSTTCWVQFLNSASGGTLGTAVIFSVPLPASTTQPIWIQPGNLALANFTTGIAVGVSTTATGSSACGTGAPAIVVEYE